MTRFVALHLLPWALCAASGAAALVCRGLWLRSLFALNVARCLIYAFGFYGLNSPTRYFSAGLEIAAGLELLWRAGFMRWALIFCAGWGLLAGDIVHAVTDAGRRDLAALHGAAIALLVVGWAIALLSRTRRAEIMLLLVYVAAAAVSSRQVDELRWWPIITTESLHFVAISAFAAIAVRLRRRSALKYALRRELA